VLSYVFWNLYVRENKFSIEKHKIFLFQVFDFWFFTKIFILQQCLNPNPNPYPNPNFFFGFGFGSSQKIRIISDSDSDPQHWPVHICLNSDSWYRCSLIYRIGRTFFRYLFMSMSFSELIYRYSNLKLFISVSHIYTVPVPNDIVAEPNP
jgi:hypothetical protein